MGTRKHTGDDQSQPQRPHTNRFGVYLQHTLRAVGTVGLGMLAVHCGSSATPESQTPAQPEALEGSSDASERAAERQSSSPADAEQPAPAAAPEFDADDLQDWDSQEDKKAVRRKNVVTAQLDLPEALAALEDFDARLSATVELGTPDCAQAETFRSAVCQLAERICTLEGGLPSSVTERHCADSRGRCRAATERYRNTCQP